MSGYGSRSVSPNKLITSKYSFSRSSVFASTADSSLHFLSSSLSLASAFNRFLFLTNQHERTAARSSHVFDTGSKFVDDLERSLILVLGLWQSILLKRSSERSLAKCKLNILRSLVRKPIATSKPIITFSQSSIIESS